MKLIKMKSERRIFFLLFLLAGLFFILAITGCKKDPEVKAAVETGTMTDIEGTIYKTVKIGKLWWMAENLKAKKYRNGRSIVAAQAIAKWNENNAAYCIYNDGTSLEYGLLYNWYAVKDSNQIAPAGWHVPTDQDWKDLEQQLGMSAADADKVNWRGSHEGEKLKKQGTQTWKQYSTIWATNESGFSALAGGCRMFSGEWSTPLGQVFTGFWWSADSLNDEAWYRYLDYKNANVFRYHGPKNYGFSIRCVMNY